MDRRGDGHELDAKHAANPHLSRVELFAEFYREEARRNDGSIDADEVVDMADSKADDETITRLTAALRVLELERVINLRNLRLRTSRIDQSIQFLHRRLRELKAD